MLRTMVPMLFVSIALLAAGAVLGDVVPLSQNRALLCSAYAEDQFGNDGYSESSFAPDLNPFVDGVSSTINLDSALASGSAHQNSTIAPQGFDINGGCAANGEGYDYDAYGDAGGRTHFECEFEVVTETSFTLVGYLEASDGGETMLSLIGPGTELELYADFNSILDVDESGTLTPGVYTFIVDANSFAYGDYFAYGYGYGGFDLDLAFSSTSAVDGSLSDALAITTSPNPFSGRAQISYASPLRAPVTLEVIDVRGRRVRNLVTGGTETGSLSWDGRDDEGRGLPPGVYFLVLRSGDRLYRDKVTLLR